MKILPDHPVRSRERKFSFPTRQKTPREIGGVLIFKNQANHETRKDGGSIFQILDLGGEEEEKGEIKRESEIVVENGGEEIVIEGADKIIVGE